MRRRIASIAPAVIDVSKEDLNARSIIDRAVHDLVELLQPLHNSRNVDPAHSLLVLAGGLVQSEIFQAKLKSALVDFRSDDTSGELFRQIVCVSDPAAAGAEYLLNEGGIR
jgi:N-acetylglucosamine kinase-like BadF-type ATPase